MPQLDFNISYSTFFYLITFFIIFYLFISFFLLPRIFKFLFVEIYLQTELNNKGKLTKFLRLKAVTYLSRLSSSLLHFSKLC